MQRRYVLALATIAGIGLLSAQQGPACPYQVAEGSGARSVDTAGVTDGTPAQGSLLSLGRGEFYAP
jgi:hypothetical protein